MKHIEILPLDILLFLSFYLQAMLYHKMDFALANIITNADPGKELFLK